MRTAFGIITTFGLTFLLATGCSNEIDDGIQGDVPGDSKGPTQIGKAEQWSDRDDPTIFTNDLELTLTELPLEGAATTVPWASSYWPVYQDSVNYRWEGADVLSPAEKYGEAFGVEGIADKVSKHHGIAKYESRTECTVDDDCDPDAAEVCAKRHGAESGRCIPSWWGICHAWAPASIMEAEPVRPVTRNGVTFKVNDIKALVSLAYNRASSRFVSMRCNEVDSLDEIEYDAYGRPTGDDVACKDTNPGTYHVLLTNYLGLRGQSFVEDRTFDAQVWNQPLRSYQIEQLEEVDAATANSLVGVDLQPVDAADVIETTFDGELARGAWHHEPTVNVSGAGKATVVMDGQGGDADLYVRFDGVPSDSDFACRPWLNGSAERCELDIPVGASAMHVSVFGYSGPATFSVDVTVTPSGADAATTYLFNGEAAKLFHVKLAVDYIAESSSETDGNLADDIDRYTFTDRYEYILEVDGAGKVFGGEWIGTSKTNHPDFLWLPTGRREQSVAGGAITYNLIKSLLDESVATTVPDGTPRSSVAEQGDLSPGQWVHFGPFESAGDITAVLSGTGDADLYLRRGEAPTSTDYDCRPYASGSDERCVGEGAGSWFVAVNGYKASTFNLALEFDEPGASTPNEPPADAPTAHLSESGEVSEGGMMYYSLDVVANRPLVVMTEAGADIDLYLKMHMAPTQAVYDQRGYTASGNERLVMTPTVNGVLFIGVHGYKASSFELTTADL